MRGEWKELEQVNLGVRGEWKVLEQGDMGVTVEREGKGREKSCYNSLSKMHKNKVHIMRYFTVEIRLIY